MRTPFRDSGRTAVQDAAEQRNLQNTELLSDHESKIEFCMPEMSENLDAMEDGNHTGIRDTRILDDKGNEVNEDNALPPNKAFVLNGIKYKTDDNGKIYMIDGKRIGNSTYSLDGKEYHTNDNGERVLANEEKDKIRAETSWSSEIIDNISSMAEYEIYKEAGLVETNVNEKKCLVRSDIDWEQKDISGKTNYERVTVGEAPITKDGEIVELHHIGQHQDSPFAELTMTEHRGKGNNTIMHDPTKGETEINRSIFSGEKKDYWQARMKGESDGFN